MDELIEWLYSKIDEYKEAIEMAEKRRQWVACATYQAKCNELLRVIIKANEFNRRANSNK